MWSKESRHTRGYGTQWTKDRALILRRDSGLCQVCMRAKRVTHATQVDHITPKAQGGTDALDNLQAICKPCHTVKTIMETGKSVRPQIGLDGWPV